MGFPMSATPRAKALIASLPMYDWPEVRGEMDLLWQEIATHLRLQGIRAPKALKRSGDYRASWLRPELLLSQTCGFPYVTRLRGKVQLVATPCYGVDGCDGSNYTSFVIVRRGCGLTSLADLGAATAAISAAESQSGHWALRAALAADRRTVGPARAVLSGGHRASLRMVAECRADVAAIDAVCWTMAKRHEREAVRKLTVIAQSPAAPSLPFITALATSKATLAALRAALIAVITGAQSARLRKMLYLTGAEIRPDKAYDRILSLQRTALGHAFPKLGKA